MTSDEDTLEPGALEQAQAHMTGIEPERAAAKGVAKIAAEMHRREHVEAATAWALIALVERVDSLIAYLTAPTTP